MTELIVALDGPRPHRLVVELHDAGIHWFKVGPQAMVSSDFDELMRVARFVRIFLDLKLADTEDTVRGAVKRFASAGIAAVSTFTDRATEAAIRGAEGSELRVWRVLRLTDAMDRTPAKWRVGDGVICSASDLREYVTFSSDIDKVCPGIRLGDLRKAELHNHKMAATPAVARDSGATHIVVGRPIWQAADPVKAAKEFLVELDDHPPIN